MQELSAGYRVLMVHFIDFVNFANPPSLPSPVDGGRCKKRMRKSNQNNAIIYKKADRSEQGSALVGAVAFSIILFVASLGYLQVVASGRNHEMTGFWDDKAFTAAESGLNMGVRWLSQQPSISNGTVEVYDLNLGDISVAVSVVGLSATLAEIRSTATTSRLTYTKTLSRRVTPRRLGWYGTFLNGVLGNNHRAQGGFIMTNFDGPTHANEALHISATGGNVITKFLGRTTVHHTPADQWNYGNGTHDDNNYDYGVEIAAHGLNFLDQNVFLDQYRHHQDQITLDRVTQTDVQLPVSLPVVQTNFEEVPSQCPYLQLTGNSATYHYWTASGPATYPIPDVNNKVIRASNILAVSGSLAGKTTIVTDPGYNIYPVGNITVQNFSADPASYYDNFNNTNNYGVAMNNTNAISLVSGKDVYFAAKWYNPTAGGVRQYVSGGADGHMYLTASIIATETGGTHRLVVSNNNLVKANTYKGPHAGIDGIRIIGSRTLDEWFQVNTGADEFLRMFFDRRLGEGILTPGIPEFRRVLDDGSQALVLNPGTWSESNIKQ
jgi:hypothetical protein